MVTAGPIVVTGAAGFVGANLVRRLLHDGGDVHVLLRPGTRTWRLDSVMPHLDARSVDLEDRDGVDRAIAAIQPQIVFHLATHGAYPSQHDARRIFRTNVEGTINLVEACRRHGFRTFVNAGSSSEYGASEQPMCEDAPLRPNSHYAIAKAATTHYCAYRARSENLPIVTLRLFSVYGAWEEPTRLMPTLAMSLLDHRLPPLVSRSTARDFVHVDDVVDAFLLAADRPDLAGHVFNVGTGVQHTIEDVVHMALAITGQSIEPVWNSMPARSWDATHWVADPSKAAARLQFRAALDLRAGLAHTLEWLAVHRSHYEYARS